MNDDRRSLNAEEQLQMNKLLERIDAAMRQEIYSDAVVIAALADKIASVTMANAAGQVVYEGQDIERSSVFCVKEAMRIITFMMQEASFRLPQMIAHMQASKNTTDAVTKH